MSKQILKWLAKQKAISLAFFQVTISEQTEETDW